MIPMGLLSSVNPLKLSHRKCNKEEEKWLREENKCGMGVAEFNLHL